MSFILSVKEFSKKTGDYPALSITDLKVLALTYQLHKEHVGLEGIKTEPTTKKAVEVIDHSLISSANIAGFHLPPGDVSPQSGVCITIVFIQIFTTSGFQALNYNNNNLSGR